MRKTGKIFWFVALLPLLVGFDYGTKQAVSSRVPLHSEVQVIDGLFSLYHTENPFIAMSIPVPLPAILAGVSLAVLAMLWLLWRLPADARLQSSAIAVVMAGAIGNLVDRVPDGRVTDFLRLYTSSETLAPALERWFGTATWPIFNVADVCVFVGASLWMLSAAAEPERPAEADA